MAEAMIEPMSESVAGRMTVLFTLARWPNCSTYFSATRSWTASMPPGPPMASATLRRPSPVASAMARMAWAWPSAAETRTQ